MKAYIDKTALIAEIEKRLHKEPFLKKNVHDAYTFGLESALKILDTLEVKEVEEEPVSKDLEEAANTYVDNWYKLNNLDKESYPIDVEISKNDFKAGAKWHKEQMIDKACNYLFSHMGLFVTFFDDDIVEDIERSEFIKKFRIAMEE